MKMMSRAGVNNAPLSYKENTCKICKEIFINTVQTSCEHKFCSFCIKIWLQTSCLCPICDKKIVETTPMPEVDQKIDNIFRMASAEVRRGRELMKNSRLFSEKKMNKDVESKAKSLMDVKKKTTYFELPPMKSGKKPPTPTTTTKVPKSTYGAMSARLPPTTAIGEFKVMEQARPKSQGKQMGSSSKQPNSKFAHQSISNLIQFQSKNLSALEKSTKGLESKLFETYDRIMEKVKAEDEAEKQLLFALGEKSVNLGYEEKMENFHRQNAKTFNQTTMSIAAPEDLRALVDNKFESGVNMEDLIEEAKDLVEIEDFLQKYPFERLEKIVLDPGHDEEIENLSDDDLEELFEFANSSSSFNSLSIQNGNHKECKNPIVKFYQTHAKKM